MPLPEITAQPQRGVAQGETSPAFTVPLPGVDETLSTISSSSIVSTTSISTTSISTASISTASISATATSEPYASATADIEKSHDREEHDEDDHPSAIFWDTPPPAPPGLSQPSEHALIAVGSIGRLQQLPGVLIIAV